MNIEDENDKRRLSEKLNLETARLPWTDLQTFFASGMVIAVDNSLDLLQVAEQMVADNAAAFEQWTANGLVGKVSDQQASEWFDQEIECWTVVIKPWVLVQTSKAVPS